MTDADFAIARKSSDSCLSGEIWDVILSFMSTGGSAVYSIAADTLIGESLDATCIDVGIKLTRKVTGGQGLIETWCLIVCR